MTAAHLQPFDRGKRLVPPLTDEQKNTKVSSDEHRRLVSEGIDPLPDRIGVGAHTDSVSDHTAHRVAPIRRTSWTADELMAFDFPDLLWAVVGIIAAGLNLLAGAPKLGKSWFALNIAVAVAAGGKALGRIDVEQGDVLYLALEDNPRRMKDRLGKVLAGATAPRALTVTVECERLTDGGLDRIRRWLEAHPLARLIVVDVFARVRGRTDARTDRYEADYIAAAELKALADEYGVAVLLVHHTRKATADDFLDTVSGTQGIAGAADAVLVLTRARNTKQAVLKITGRDVQEAEYALELDPAIGVWQLLETPAAEVDLGDTRRRILDHLRSDGAGPIGESTRSATPKEIAGALKINPDTARQTVRRMVEAGQLDTDGAGHYFEPLSPVTPVTVSHPESDSSDSCDTHSQDDHDRARARAVERYE
jgi:hypothetical protein